MKTAVALLATAIASLPFSLFAAPDSSAIADWYAITSQANAQIVSGNTSSPVYDGLNSESPGMIFAYFPARHLPDQEKLTVSFEMTLEMEDAQTSFGEFRLGLFQSGSLKASERFGEKRTGRDLAVTEGWKGFLLFLPNLVEKTKPILLYRRLAEHESNYALKSGLDLRSAFTRAIAAPHFQHGSPHLFTLTLERDGFDLSVTLTLDEESSTGRLSNAFADDYEVEFDALGIYAAGGSAQIRCVRFSQAQLLPSAP